MWPMRAPVLVPVPLRIISSSVQSVPSKNTRRRAVEARGQRRRSCGRSPARSRRARRRRAPRARSWLRSRRRSPARLAPDRGRPCPARRTAGSVSPADLDWLVERRAMARDVARIEHVEDRVARERVENRAGRVKLERLALAQRQQAGDVVDVAIGQHDRRDRAMPRRRFRMQRRRRQDLLAQVGRGVEQDPALPVGADRERALRAPARRRICSPGTPADRQALFHCGKPPPAAEPRTMMCMPCADLCLRLAVPVSRKARRMETRASRSRPAASTRGLTLRTDTDSRRRRGGRLSLRTQGRLASLAAAARLRAAASGRPRRPPAENAAALSASRPGRQRGLRASLRRLAG